MRPIEGLVRRLWWVDVRGAHHIQAIQYLGGEMVPQLEQEIQTSGCKGGYEGVLERLDSALGRVDPVVVGLHKLELAFLFGEKFLDIFSCLIVHDI
jgi:hypothetical protein